MYITRTRNPFICTYIYIQCIFDQHGGVYLGHRPVQLGSPRTELGTLIRHRTQIIFMYQQTIRHLPIG